MMLRIFFVFGRVIH